MSQQELVKAYVGKKLDRREFIKRLAGLGISLAAAGVYAEVLLKSASAQGLDPKYGARPIIRPLNPEPGSEITDRTPAIKVRVRDRETDLRKKDMYLFFDSKSVGRDFVYDREKNLLVYKKPGRLAYGWHTVKVSATDGRLGPFTERSWRFKVVGAGWDVGTGHGGW